MEIGTTATRTVWGSTRPPSRVARSTEVGEAAPPRTPARTEPELSSRVDEFEQAISSTVKANANPYPTDPVGGWYDYLNTQAGLPGLPASDSLRDRIAQGLPQYFASLMVPSGYVVPPLNYAGLGYTLRGMRVTSLADLMTIAKQGVLADKAIFRTGSAEHVCWGSPMILGRIVRAHASGHSTPGEEPYFSVIVDANLGDVRTSMIRNHPVTGDLPAENIERIWVFDRQEGTFIDLKPLLSQVTWEQLGVPERNHEMNVMRWSEGPSSEST